MAGLRELPGRRALCWWLAVLAVALSIKHQYSVATAADLTWMLYPLSLLLEWLSGHPFHRNAAHEWVSLGADVRLVKACAGINFMIMSILAWAWTLRPRVDGEAGLSKWISKRLLLLGAIITAAWVTSLLANSLRIVAAMSLPDSSTELHRLIGLLVYVPLLSLQLLAGNRDNWRAALLGPVLLYFLLTALVPLLTGNAFSAPSLFAGHLLSLAAMAVAVGLIFSLYLGYQWLRSRPG